MCGNYLQASVNQRIALGSPPRVRELLHQSSSKTDKTGITPACAGITVRRWATATEAPDHPRVCGNYCHPHKSFTGIGGSPPRVRELPPLPRGSPCMRRITPACAGITRYSGADPGRSWDHPRVCGNYQSDPVIFMRGQGSPPRVRELRSFLLGVIGCIRITPACAGITISSVGAFLYLEDHPRVCGNY